MSDYRIFESKEFRKRLDKLDIVFSKFMKNKLTEFVYPQLRINPVFGKNIKMLKGYKPKTWRYRIGDFRVFYSINFDEMIVYILTVDHRKNAYR